MYRLPERSFKTIIYTDCTLRLKIKMYADSGYSRCK